MDSVVSWLLLTMFSLWGIGRFLWFLICENERRLAESEEAWQRWERGGR